MATIGFTSTGSAAAKKQKNSKGGKNTAPLLRFDNGEILTVDDGRHNMITLGSTGCGKTSCFILPTAERLIQRGFSGLCVDIKGNFTPQIKALAKKYGREGDVIEFGPCADATPINLLSGDSAQVRSFFHDALHRPGYTTNNGDFDSYNVTSAMDVYTLLSRLARHNTLFCPSLSTIQSILCDVPLGYALFLYFMEFHFDKKNVQDCEYFYQMINREFTPVSFPKAGENKDYYQQMAWRLDRVLNLLTEFVSTRGIEEKFFNGNAVLDMDELVYKQKKIICLRFPPDAEYAGTFIARYFLTEYYKSVFRNGLSLPQGEHTFVIADELQQFLKLGGQHGDDMFIARSREYNNIFICASQSISALHAKGSEAEIKGLLNNFRTKVIFRCDDPDTVTWAEMYNIDTLHIPQGHAGLLHSNVTHESFYGIAPLQKEHDRLQPFLKKIKVEPFSYGEPNTRHSCMKKILRGLSKKYRQNQTLFKKLREVGPEVMIRKVESRQPFPPTFLDMVEENITWEKIIHEFPQYFRHGNNLLSLAELPSGWVEPFYRALHICRSERIRFSIIDGQRVGGGFMFHFAQGLESNIFCELFKRFTQCVCPMCGNEHKKREDFGGLCEDCVPKKGRGKRKVPF